MLSYFKVLVGNLTKLHYFHVCDITIVALSKYLLKELPFFNGTHQKKNNIDTCLAMIILDTHNEISLHVEPFKSLSILAIYS